MFRLPNFFAQSRVIMNHALGPEKNLNNSINISKSDEFENDTCY